MRFEQNFIEKVREANDVVDIISEFTQLKGSGSRLMGLCPFPGHKEKTPSFSVSRDKQVYHCFGCKKSGNIYTFLEEMKGLSFPEAVEYLAQRASIAIPKETYEAIRKFSVSDDDREQKKVLYKINKVAAEFYHRQLLNLPPDHAFKKYCRQRGISEATVAAFQIGAALDEWENLTRYLQRIGAPLAQAESLGLIKPRQRGTKGHFDLFRGRLMFPIISPAGNHIGFGGRVVGEGQPKYLNSPESPVFNKGKMFYGLHETAKYIREKDSVLVVEGYMDLIALYQAGIQNVVATLGTALTSDHARLLSRFTKNVLVLFDGDEAGLSAAQRSLPVLLEQGLRPKHFIIPEQKDPDDYVKQVGAQSFLEQLSEAPELFHTVLNSIFSTYHGRAVDKVAVVDQVKPLLESMKDERLRDLYLDELGDRMQVDRHWLKSAMGPARAIPAPAEPERELTGLKTQNVKEKAGKVVIKSPPKAEWFLLNLALMREEHFKAIWASNIVTEFSHSGLKEIFHRAADAYGQMPSEFDKLTALLATYVEPASVISLHLDKTWQALGLSGEQKLIADCTRKVRESYLRAKAREEISNLRGQPPSEQLKKLEQIVNIHSSRRNLQKD